MPIDLASWVFITILVVNVLGVTATVFLDELKAWFERILDYILDSINQVIEKASNAIAYLVKEGIRVYKKIVVFVRNIVTGKYFKRYKEEEISPYDIPEELRSQLDNNPNLAVYEYKRKVG